MAVNDIALADFKIFCVGFSSHEKATIEMFFQLASHRAPHWGVTSNSSDARVVLIDAMSEKDIAAFKPNVAQWQHVVIVGASDYGTGWAVIPRPLKLTAILNVLNEVVKTVMHGSFRTENTRVQTHTPVLAASQPVVAAPQVRAPSAVLLRNSVLVVDDSDIALKYMQNRLSYFGYECELAKSGEEAMSLVAKYSYNFVFLDVTMAGMDGYKTCRAIKSYKARHGPVPVVVMVTSRGGTIDKIRGAMAGCDAYLTKPVNEKELTLVLKKYDDSTAIQRWEAVHPREPLIDKYAANL